MGGDTPSIGVRGATRAEEEHKQEKRRGAGWRVVMAEDLEDSASGFSFSPRDDPAEPRAGDSPFPPRTPGGSRSISYAMTAGTVT